MKSRLGMGAIILLVTLPVVIGAQTETLTNADVLALAQAGIGEDILVAKIRNTDANFDVSAKALLELKKAGISDYVVALMLDSDAAKRNKPGRDKTSLPYSETEPKEVAPKFKSAGDAVRAAKTIALVKDSLQPARQALEKELLKRPEWTKLNLTIERYKNNADLYVEIGFVHLSLLTHRYVYRIYDRRTGAVLAAGETTSWGSLAENLARHIAKSLEKLAQS